MRWVNITRELIRREELEKRGITTQIVSYIFPLLHAPLPPPLRTPLQQHYDHLLHRTHLNCLLGQGLQDSAREYRQTTSSSVQNPDALPIQPKPIVLSCDEEDVELEEGFSKDQEMGEQGLGNDDHPCPLRTLAVAPVWTHVMTLRMNSTQTVTPLGQEWICNSFSFIFFSLFVQFGFIVSSTQGSRIG